ncbi:MAG: aminotransferase class IV [Flavobacteriaceae bacterium]|nr:aminotransferase class IV [Flavobacteriaceae bacterium]
MVNLNGKLQHKQEGKVSINNRGLQYGDAVFETLKVVSSRINFWEDHYFRLMASMRILRMEIPMTFSMEFLEEEILRTVEASNLTNNTCRVKLYVNRKEGGKYTPKTNDVNYFITLEKLDIPFYMMDDAPYEVELFKDYFIYSNLLSTLKTNSKITNVLGSIFAAENGYQNCLLLNENKMVVEVLQGNLFMVKGNLIITPPITDGCLRGIIRKQLIAICELSKEYSLEEKSISPFDLQKADELFISNVITGIQPITKYRKKDFTNKISKELLQKLNMKAKLSSVND